MATHPNVLWIFGDQHPAHLLSCTGNSNLHTPNLDMMAARGTRFVNAVSGYPLCCPFRGALVTSRYPHQCVTGHEVQLPPAHPTAADAFKEYGYHTAYFGKWHLDGWHEADGRAAFHVVPPTRRGRFDDWLGYENNNQQFDCYVHGHLHGEEVPVEKLPGYETDALTDRLIGYMGNHFSEKAGTPLFTALSVQPPHDPYWTQPEDQAGHRPSDVTLRPNVPPIARIEEQARLSISGAAAQVENLDKNVGRILTALGEMGQLENTVILFFSDHGDMHGSHGLMHKHVPYQESVNIPFIVFDGRPFAHYPKTHNTTSQPINHVDILPTSLGMAGLPSPAWAQGTDCSALALRPGSETAGLPHSAFLQNLTGGHCMQPWRAIVTREGYKYVVAPNMPWMLFDLNEDPYELNNLVMSKKMDLEWLGALNQELSDWITTTGDAFEMPVTPDPRANHNT